MGIWKSLFGKSQESKEDTKPEEPLPYNYREFTRSAIELMGKNASGMEDEELHQLFTANGIAHVEANEFLIFIPVAFCRKMLHRLSWPPDYVDYYSEKKQIKRTYKENKRYLIIEEETANYWDSGPANEWVLSIVERSSEFQAINQLLNKGGDLKDVQLTTSYIMRFS